MNKVEICWRKFILVSMARAVFENEFGFSKAACLRNVFSVMINQMKLRVDIRATDTAGLFDTFTLTVMINPVNQPPTFSPSNCNAHVAEGQVSYVLFVLTVFAFKMQTCLN
jgi:hypothetical protein